METSKKFKIGQRVEFHPPSSTYRAAKVGATAIIQGFPRESTLIVAWIRDGKDHGQMNGSYPSSEFIPIEMDWDE